MPDYFAENYSHFPGFESHSYHNWPLTPMRFEPEPDTVAQTYFDVVTGEVKQQRVKTGEPVLRIPGWFYRVFPVDKLTHQKVSTHLDVDNHVWVIYKDITRPVFDTHYETTTEEYKRINVPDELWEECLANQVLKKLTE